jgi:hypothetical protein
VIPRRKTPFQSIYIENEKNAKSIYISLCIFLFLPSNSQTSKKTYEISKILFICLLNYKDALNLDESRNALRQLIDLHAIVLKDFFDGKKKEKKKEEKLAAVFDSINWPWRDRPKIIHKKI